MCISYFFLTCAAGLFLIEACEAGVRIKPGARAPGSNHERRTRARETGDSYRPGARAPGFMLTPAPQAKQFVLAIKTLRVTRVNSRDPQGEFG